TDAALGAAGAAGDPIAALTHCLRHGGVDDLDQVAIAWHTLSVARGLSEKGTKELVELFPGQYTGISSRRLPGWHESWSQAASSPKTPINNSAGCVSFLRRRLAAKSSCAVTFYSAVAAPAWTRRSPAPPRPSQMKRISTRAGAFAHGSRAPPHRCTPSARW